MIYFRLYGRLGNLLFQYATAMSIGHGKAIGVTDDEGIMRALKSYGDLFVGLEVVPRAPANARIIRQYKCNFIELPREAKEDVLLDGYFQSDRYFDEKLVRSRFGIPDRLRADLMIRYADTLASPGVTSVHVRRGDYLQLPQFHPFVGEKYFERCLSLLPEVRDFVICSDDMTWCREFFPRRFPGRRFRFSEEKTALADMYLCSLCHNHILSNSSFSWWGGWLDPRPDKKVFAPSVWFGYALRRGGIDWSSLYARGTTVVNNRHSLAFWWAAHRAEREARKLWKR